MPGFVPSSNGVARDSRMETYFLRSKRLGFRQWNQNDYELAWNLWGEPEVTQFIGGPFSEGAVQQRLVREIEIERLHGLQYWPIFELSSGAHVGCCGLRPYRINPRIDEIGFHIGKVHWGRGYASEAARTVIAFAFERLAVSGLFAGHNPKNAASATLLKKLGFTYTHDEYYAPTGLNHPSYLLERPENVVAWTE